MSDPAVAGRVRALPIADVTPAEEWPREDLAQPVDPELVRRIAGDPALRSLRPALVLAKACGDPPGALVRAVLAQRLPNVAAALDGTWSGPLSDNERALLDLHRKVLGRPRDAGAHRAERAARHRLDQTR